MHEFELGVWKGTFTHLIRVLVAAGRDGCQSLDDRYDGLSRYVVARLNQILKGFP